MSDAENVPSSAIDLGLKDKIVLVTGGWKGIGFAAARAFLAEGARGAIASRSQENLDRACAGCPGQEAFAANLTLPPAAAQLIDAVEHRLGAIDVLVNCAGAAKRANADQPVIKRPAKACASSASTRRRGLARPAYR